MAAPGKVPPHPCVPCHSFSSVTCASGLPLAEKQGFAGHGAGDTSKTKDFLPPANP
jgi:hypothetical protein